MSVRILRRVMKPGRFMLIGLSLLAICSQGLKSQQLLPYLQSPTDTSIWISWKTDADTESLVQYGQDSSALVKQVTGSCQILSDEGYNNNYYYHSVHLMDLDPDQAYYYRIVTGNRQSDIHRFITPSPPGKATGIVRFLVLGDHQVKDSGRYEELMKSARDKIIEKYGENVEDHIQLIINDGDQVDMGTLDQYENMHLKPSALLSGNIPIMTTVGNHETYGTLGLSAYYDHFFYDDMRYNGIISPGGEDYYSYQRNNIVFVHLSSEHPTDEQEAWVQQIVDSVRVDPTVNFLISIGHRPIQAEQYVGDISEYIRSRIIPILAQTEKSTLFISGHHHLYARGQVRDHPIYHIISGGASWDQFWGQSIERDFDDVQKTIDFWTYQIVSIDADAAEMVVECYAAGSPKLGFTLDNILIDSFYRKFPAMMPGTPSITTAPSDSVDLPFTFASSPYQQNDADPCNSVQFQISSDPDFNKPEVDLIRDFENLYGTTGIPDYLPVDIYDTVDIFRYTIRKNALRNGSYFVRVRHRDRNITWSEWSDAVVFSVRGSLGGPTSISTVKSVFDPGESISVNYEFGPGNGLDWIGIYREGEYPSNIPSTDWEYVSGSTGTVTLDVPGPGQYFIAFFENDGYYELTERVNVYVSSESLLSMDKAGYETGDEVKISYTNAPGIPLDWIGIYRLGDTPGEISSTLWEYTFDRSGTISFSGLVSGYYYTAYFLNDGYTEAGERIIFSVGSELARVQSDSEIYEVGAPVGVNFENGPGLSSDWIGIFRKNAPPGVAPLVDRKFTPGEPSGQVIFEAALEPGNYYAAMYINNSTFRISNETDFRVEQGTNGLREDNIEMVFNVYPSGTPGVVRIVASPLPAQLSSIRITNISGSVIRELEMTGSATPYSGDIDLTGYAQGIYLAIFQTGYQVIVRKFILN